MAKAALTVKDCESLIRGILNYLHGRKIIATKLRHGRVSVSFLPNAELRRLKKKYLKKDMAIVDVLSFPEKENFPNPESKATSLGEIFINKSISARNPVRARYLLLHGLLHLLGYDHVRKSDNIEMRKTELMILKKMGWQEE